MNRGVVGHSDSHHCQVRRKNRRRTTWVVALLLSCHVSLLAFGAARQSPTLNEPAHLVAGLIHWEFRRFEVYRVNPPLVHYVAAIPVIRSGYKPAWSAFYNSPGARPEFKLGEDFIHANGDRSLWLIVIARWACLPFSLIGAVCCFCWSRELWGRDAAGIVSLCLWCLDPNIIGYGQLLTPDCAAASLGLGAGYLFWRWLKLPNRRRAIAAGLVLGLAELTKTIWVMLFGLWPALWLFWLWMAHRRRGRFPGSDQLPFAAISRTFGQLALLLLLALYILNLGYCFDGTLARLKDFTFVSRALSGEAVTGEPGNRYADTWIRNMPVPLPRQYLQGIDLQMKDFELYEHPSYLRGQWKYGGWWYYYLYGLAVKSSHGTQLLVLLAIGVLVRRRWLAARANNDICSEGGRQAARSAEGAERMSPAGLNFPPPSAGPRDVAAQVSHRPAQALDLVVLGAPAIAVLVLVSSQLEFNHHVRYVLPAVGFVLVLTGAAATCADGESLRHRAWHVSPEGDDQGDGTASHPMRSLDAGLKRAGDGDTVLLAPGEYQGHVQTRVAGVTVVGPAEAIVRGPEGSRAIEILHDRTVIRGITIEQADIGVWLFGARDCRLEDLTLRDIGGEGVRIRNGSCHNVVRRCRFERMGRTGFDVARGRKNGEGVYLGTAPEQRSKNNPPNQPDHCTGNVVEDCEFRTEAAEAVDIKEDSEGNTVRRCRGIDSRDPDGAIFGSRGDRNRFEECVAEQGSGHGFRFGGDTVANGQFGQSEERTYGRDNVMRNCRATGNALWGAAPMVQPQDIDTSNVFEGNGRGAVRE